MTTYYGCTHYTYLGANYRKERCADKGAYPPFPFMNGALELLSAPLVRYVGTSPEVGRK